jgi:hypothetical protein
MPTVRLERSCLAWLRNERCSPERTKRQTLLTPGHWRPPPSFSNSTAIASTCSQAPPSPRYGEANGKHLLSDGWSVNSRDDLLKTLTWLQFQGHRSEFEQLGVRLDRLTERQLLTVEAAAQNNPRALNKLEITLKNHRALGTKGILAWDLLRYIAVCRWSSLAGYFSDTEAWDHIMPAALRLQQTFDSWQDLQSNFLIGREYWSLQDTQLATARIPCPIRVMQSMLFMCAYSSAEPIEQKIECAAGDCTTSGASV